MYYLIFTACLLALLVHLIRENYLHQRRVESIPIRVLVNGIRGKSSITRLIAGALRGGGYTVVAKTTGTAARYIYPGGRETPIPRKFGLANVIEQVEVVRRAVRARPDALVMECMAVDPNLQEINQRKLVKATIGVICNVREDHLAEMGPTLDDVARSLSRSMPVGGICITAERQRFHVLRAEADRRHCRLLYADPRRVTEADMARFSWITFPENVAVALAVAELIGVRRAAALRGMHTADPDPGVLRVDRCQHSGRTFEAVNLFAANDPESTLLNIEQINRYHPPQGPVGLVINCRPDRVERNMQMGEIVPDIAPHAVFLIGTPTRSALRAIPSRCRPAVVDLGGEQRTGTDILDAITDRLRHPTFTLLLVGNIHGRGESLLEALHPVPGPSPRQLARQLAFAG